MVGTGVMGASLLVACGVGGVLSVIGATEMANFMQDKKVNVAENEKLRTFVKSVYSDTMPLESGKSADFNLVAANDLDDLLIIAHLIVVEENKPN